MEKLLVCIANYYKIIKHDQGIQQSLQELYEVYKFLQNRKFNNFVEIGTSLGGSLWLYSLLFCNKNATINGIDIEITKETEKVSEYLKTKKLSVNLLQGKGISFTDKFKNIDLLHIDDNHNYDTVSSHFYKYYPLMAKGGIIILHDTSLHYGCIKLREELEKKYDIKTFRGSLLLNHIGDNIIPGVSIITKNNKQCF